MAQIKATDSPDAILMEFFRKVRPEVLVFAIMMEQELANNDHRGGWKGCHPADLFEGLVRDSVKLGNALLRDDLPKALEQCADVANMAMMVADTLMKGQLCAPLPAEGD